MIQNLFWDVSSKLLSWIPLALAEDGKGPKPDGSGPEKTLTQIDLFDPFKGKGFTDLLNSLIDGLLLLAVPVTVVMIIVGAYYIITSGGNPGKRTKGKDYILWSVIGFAILILAKSVVLIVRDFLKL